MIFVDVILPLPLDKVFTYSVPQEYENANIGCRVIVQFGNKKYYTGIVLRVYESDEPLENIKEIVSLLDEKSIVLPSQLDFWKWISSYYMSSLGDVYKAALPSALKLESETYVIKNANFESEAPLTPTEQKVFYAISDKQTSKISELSRELKINNIIPHIKSLSDKRAIHISENLKSGYSSKTETIIFLAKNFSDKELNFFLDGLKRAQKQQKLLSAFLELREDSNEEKQIFSTLKQDLLQKANVSPQILDALINRGILKSSEQNVSRFDYGDVDLDASNLLNQAQTKAYKSIKQSFSQKPVTLLHGVTSSGKTEIYIQLIKEVLKQGKQVLYLLPEIALTTQITNRLKSVFGNKLSVYHSKFNDNERAEIWTDLLLENGRKVVLGARSAIFLPFKNLELIIVDEEHESSYKQQDPAPRYNARNSAIVLGNIHSAKVLLGTATPAIETYHNALTNKYGLVSLNKRYDDIELPRILPIDTKELKRKKQMKHILSPPLINETKNALEKKEQIILFQNRRGFAPLLECKTCSWTPVCEHCDVSLTYHKGQRTMSCHYCGATYEIPQTCANCETPTLEILGYGTERIEEEVKELFPEANVSRMDLDTTRSKRAYERIISGLENQETDILIGTQMVSKGLDFDNVSIVGILNADSSLNYPDFRAHEKTFQLMTQVSGRAGRKNKQGLVILQTSQPSHPIINQIINNDYKGFYKAQIDERLMFHYPPFYRLISIVMKGRDEHTLDAASKQFAASLRNSFGDKILGPTKPPVSRIQSLYIRNILIKVSPDASSPKVRDGIKLHQQHIFSQAEYRSILVYFDVDPLM